MSKGADIISRCAGGHARCRFDMNGERSACAETTADDRPSATTSLAAVASTQPAGHGAGMGTIAHAHAGTTLAGGKAGYPWGVFNGTVDGRDALTSNPGNKLEYAGRVFFEPFKEGFGAWAGLGFGVGASIGDARGSGNNFLPRYRTPGQATFFSYRGTVLADGRHARWSPQAYYYRDAFGLQVEYIVSRQKVATPTAQATLSNKAWQATASYVLTGEDAGYRGVTRPSHPFVPGGEGWGAWELVGRYGVLGVDDAAFPLFASADASARRAAAWTLGVNWYLTGNLKLVLDYTQARFDGGAAAGTDREKEKTVFSRLQVSF